MLKVVVLVLFVAVIVDGTKLLFEMIASSRSPKFNYSFDPPLVTVIIPSHNGESSISDTLRSLVAIFDEERIIVVDDASTDNTKGVIKKNFPNVRLICLPRNKGKVKAIEEALRFVKTPFVLLVDDDTVLPEDFRCPTSLMGKVCTAAAFHITPLSELPGQPLWRKLVNSLQTHEYAKAMQVGRKAHNETRSVYCVSGAAGLFTTRRLKETYHLHSGISPADDLERTLIELINEGKIIIVSETVYTRVPGSLRALGKQRIFRWWPGLYQNILLLLRILFKRTVPLRLRWVMGYEIYNLLATPFKVFSLAVIIANREWLIFGTVYALYLLFEICSYLKISTRHLWQPALTLLLYPLYGFGQILFYSGALLVFIWKWLLKREWRLC